jgi:hypothetical protein
VTTQLPDEVLTALGQQIGIVINNTIFALWASGDEEAARAGVSIQQIPRSPLTDFAGQRGFSICHITAVNPKTASQLPDCMIFLLPVHGLDRVVKTAFQTRQAFLEELTKQGGGTR